MNTKKNRLIAVIFFKSGNIVQSKLFKQHRVVGDPYTIIERLSFWNADEVIYLNIRPELLNINRQDKSLKYASEFDKIIELVGKKAFMPLTVGGGIRSVKDAEKFFKMGADKISINTMIIENPSFVYNCSRIYGSQSIVASIDIKKDSEGRYNAYTNSGKEKVNRNLFDYIKNVEELGVGELLINNIDRDGMAQGYDLKLLKLIQEITTLPIIFTGGVGRFDDFVSGIRNNLNAVAAGNIFHFSENSYYEAMKLLNKKKCNTRPATLGLKF